MNLQDKNLKKDKIKKKTRMLKSLGIDGLFISLQQKADFNSLIDKNVIQQNQLTTTKVLFIGEGLDSADSKESFLFKNIVKAMNIPAVNIKILDVDTLSFMDYKLNGNKMFVDLLDAEVKRTEPIVLVSFGSKISQILLKSNASVANQRNKFFNFLGAKLLCTLDLSLLLKDSSKKRLVWEDMQMAMKEVASEE